MANRSAPFSGGCPPAIATDALKDLAELRAEDTIADDFIDLGESQTFTPEVMDGECAS